MALCDQPDAQSTSSRLLPPVQSDRTWVPKLHQTQFSGPEPKLPRICLESAVQNKAWTDQG
ncbi:hypothetical protein E4U43_006324 [Claviceps pusilla]|uniref:Uncharacterized protein n=1 Tax=Claviceps pusilla TaxID=123648 RepID=A0A9P7NDW8_9HYPO|nr:hypothetical protein E4U43_006324 [Claviceps pusilla]